MKDYFYNLLHKYLSVYIFSEDKIVSVEPVTNRLINKFKRIKIAFICGNANTFGIESGDIDQVKKYNPDYILLNGCLHFERDIQSLLQKIHHQCHSHTRVIITYYSSLWKPLMRLATLLGLREKPPESNWISPEDIDNFLLLSNFEIVNSESKILIPIYVPLVSFFANKYLAPLPLFRIFNWINIVIVRPVALKLNSEIKPSVSVVVPARNEAGNIENIIRRLPKMGPDDELILVEGNSSDNTWEKIEEVYENNRGKINILIAKQDGIGKGDAVRKGFSMATKDILMILDADLTVPPEDLPKFYEGIVTGKGEYVHCSRLVYPQEKGAMRFFNIVANKFFANSFSFVLGQKFKDTLCGTKVITRRNYLKLAQYRSYFGEFDPFGDFDLIFGSARMNLKMVEIPIGYCERTYGKTNISRWRHGVLLLRMLIFAALKIKFI
jgi:hypothetical protein